MGVSSPLPLGWVCGLSSRAGTPIGQVSIRRTTDVRQLHRGNLIQPIGYKGVGRGKKPSGGTTQSLAGAGSCPHS